MPRTVNRHSLRFAVLAWIAAGLWALACTAKPGNVVQPDSPPSSQAPESP